MKSIVFLSLVLSNAFAFALAERTYQLELVQAIFRHGDRIPDKEEVYKTDPYDPKHYEPTGYGQLTKKGMEREYKIGKLLRRRYGDFLGEFRANKVYGYSSDYDRTKASLQLVFAGTFPPSLRSAWNRRLRWTPIPTHYKPAGSDSLLSSAINSCGGLKKWQQTVESVLEFQERLNKYEDFLDYVRNKTLIGGSRAMSAVLVASNLRAIRSMGLKLPSWCSERDYELLTEILGLAWKSLSITQELRKVTAGPMVKEFLENMKNHKVTDKRKIYLYGGHDVNIASFTGAHNFTGIPDVPQFGSTVIIEKLRGSDKIAYVRMFLWTGVTERLIKLKLKNCDYECPLSTYESIMTPDLPDAELFQCYLDRSCGLEQRTKEANPAFRLSLALAGPDAFTFKYGNEALI